MATEYLDKTGLQKLVGLIKSSLNEKVSESSMKEWLLNNVYTVGYVWVSYTDTSPASILGGTWTPITGRFPYFNAGTDTGGSNTHTLSLSEMPSHNHSSNELGVDSGSLNSNTSYAWSALRGANRSNHLGTTGYVSKSGGGNAHNNMPAYQTLYAWRRTA